MSADMGADQLVDLSRLQFAVTAMYHFLFVPLTLGMVWLLVIMESIYVMTGKIVYKDMTRFWGKLFGINFALGVTTGITLEFQFGTNWAYYSHYVGDVFGAPLALGHKFSGQLQAFPQDQGSPSGRGAKVAIPRTHGKTIRLPHDGTDHNLDRHVQVANHAADHQGLLIIFLPEISRVGPDDLKQLEHHGGHSTEMAAATLPFQRFGHSARLDPSAIACGVHLLVGWREY